ncbi:MAG: GNAT family N-acetyltransferase [Candidatus Shapirobacteria bacterium]|nr:GNAT family N-acetyltransferase [Candidatus Shapirobacteria bacterium]
MKIGQDVFVQQGILDCQITQLIDYSQTDSDIKKFTSDQTRFADKNTFSQWQQQGRIIYTLIDPHQNLLGFIWFGQKDPPLKIKANFTFAIRIYGSARGQGLSQEFMKIVFADLLKNQTDSHITGFWLETHSENSSAIHVYQKFGFKTVAQKDNSVIMVL